MSNLFKEFQKLVGPRPLMVGDVVLVGDLATVALLGGGEIKVRGAAELGQRVFIRDGVIEGEAPALPMVQIEI